MTLYQITEIEFDFTYDLGESVLDLESQDEIYDEVLNSLYEADDEDHLCDLITDAYGWGIMHIDYTPVEEDEE
jgi:hypothetical protein